MIDVGGFAFPDTEKHFTQFGDSVAMYGERDRVAAYAYVRRWRRALDVGANVGIFSVAFAQRFEEVVAFEPMPQPLECLHRNVPANVRVEPVAIADQAGTLRMMPTFVNCGGSFIYDHPDVPQLKVKKGEEWLVEVSARTIDSYDFDAVDLIKLDIQGAEYLALMGARETIQRHRPVVMVEEKPISAEDMNFRNAAKLLTSLGMSAKERAKTDRVFVFED